MNAFVYTEASGSALADWVVVGSLCVFDWSICGGLAVVLLVVVIVFVVVVVVVGPSVAVAGAE